MSDPNDQHRALQQPRHMDSYGWWVATDDRGGNYEDYLHDDLNVYFSTENGDKSSGWFTSKEAAEKAIADYNAKWNCPTAKQIINHEDAFDRAMKGI